jgi:hypothetical protein
MSTAYWPAHRNGVDLVGDGDGDLVSDRPQGGDHVPVAGELERGGDVDRLVCEPFAGLGGGAGGQEGQFRVMQAEPGDVENGQRPGLMINQ